MSGFIGAGWGLRDERLALYVGRLPRRRSVAVYTVEGSVLNVVAYCRDEEEARRLIATLDRLIPTGAHDA